MSESLSRDALIEKVAGLIDDQYDDYSPRYNAAGVCVSSVMAAAAVDATLRVVADDLDAQARRRQGIPDPLAQAHMFGLQLAAERVRDLLGKDKTNE